MLLLQTDFPIVNPEQIDTTKLAGDIEQFKGLTFMELINKLAQISVDFVIHVAIAIAVFYAGKFIISKLYRLVSRLLIKRNVDQSLTTFVLSMIRIVLYFILTVTVIGILGINTTSFLAIFASAGVAVGMALSGTLQNFAGGVLILLLKPYRIGDYIEAQGYAGTVTEIQIFHTIICTPDNKTIIIPNGGLSTGSINNWSRQGYRRISWNVSLAYGTDFDDVVKAILEIVENDPRTITSKEDVKKALSNIPEHSQIPEVTPKVVLDSLADSAIVVSVRAWALTSDYWGLYYDMQKELYTELPRRGFSFPFPQLDVHFPGTSAPEK